MCFEDFFLKCAEHFFILGREVVIVEMRGADIADTQKYVALIFLEEGIELGLVEPVAFADRPLDSVAVDSMVEFAFGTDNKYLYGLCGIGAFHPTDTERKYQELMTLIVKLVNGYLPIQAFAFWEGVLHDGYLFSPLFCSAAAFLRSSLSALRAADLAFFSSMSCL